MAKNWTLDFFGGDSEQPVVSGEPYVSANGIINYVASLASGARPVNTRVVARNDCVAASGTVTLAAGVAADTFTATINGVACGPVTFATDNTATAVLLAAAINASASALVSGHVTATSALGVVTITAKNPGVSGNAITLAASKTGTGTATASGARLTGGSETSITFNL